MDKSKQVSSQRRQHFFIAVFDEVRQEVASEHLQHCIHGKVCNGDRHAVGLLSTAGKWHMRDFGGRRLIGNMHWGHMLQHNTNNNKSMFKA